MLASKSFSLNSSSPCYCIRYLQHEIFTKFCSSAVAVLVLHRSLSQLPVQSLSLVGSGVICDNIPGLISRQRRLCRQHPDVMLSVVHGAKRGVQQCQKQFRDHRWNCSTSHTDASVFGKLMLKGEFDQMLCPCIHRALCFF